MPHHDKRHAFYVKNHVKFFTKGMKFTKLNICNMVEMHVNHGFRHDGGNQKNCYNNPQLRGWGNDNSDANLTIKT